MEKLESNLTIDDLSIYKKAKGFFINRYKNYDRSIRFNSKKGLISYANALLSKYSTYNIEDAFNILPDVAQRKITNISSIASSEEDAYIMSTVLLDFISNCDASMVNGGVKFAVYSIMYLSDLSMPNMQFINAMTNIISNFVSSRADVSNQAYSTYTQILENINLIKNTYFSDILFSVLSSVFSYVQKLIIYFSNYFSEDERLKNIVYKQSIAVVQTQIKYLAELFITDFLLAIKELFPKFVDPLSEYYLKYLNYEIFQTVNVNLPSVVINPDYFSTKDTLNIGIAYLTDINNITYNVIPDLISFSSFLETLDDNYFSDSKENLIKTIYEFLKV